MMHGYCRRRDGLIFAILVVIVGTLASTASSQQIMYPIYPNPDEATQAPTEGQLLESTNTRASSGPTMGPTQQPTPLETIVSDNGESETCSLKCLHQTECVKGNQTSAGHALNEDGTALDFHAELNLDGWHCDCPPGMTGLRCGRPFMSCEIDDDPEAGVLFCYHGGECIPGLIDGFGNNQMFCDCTEATHIDENVVTKYSGKYCQEPIDASLSLCHLEDGVCKNGGVCKSSANHEDPCDCPNGFTGKYCEYEEDAVPVCTKTCNGNGNCRLGSRGSDRSDGLQYCECSAAYFGEDCEFESKQCGTTYCRHGSRCIEFLLSDGTMQHMCDCTPSYTDDLYFAGQYCQYPSTSFCSPPDDINGRQFCTNGGICAEDQLDGCICPTGFAGPRCDHKLAESDEAYASCSLDCHNDGVCRKGKKIIDVANDRFAKNADHLLDAQAHLDMEHCVCPQGFFGVKCEYSATTCGVNEHTCFHGSTCIENGKEVGCDCDTSIEKTAGLSCQFFASAECTRDSEFKSDDPEYRGFCTNGGICMKDDRDVIRCRCPQGYEGPHCEYQMSGLTSWSTDNGDDDEKDVSYYFSPITIALCVACVLMAGGTLFYLKWRQSYHMPTTTSIGKDNDHTTSSSSTSRSCLGDQIDEAQRGEHERYFDHQDDPGEYEEEREEEYYDEEDESDDEDEDDGGYIDLEDDEDCEVEYFDNNGEGSYDDETLTEIL